MERERGSDDLREEPTPGQGIRSLQSWQRLAAARRALAGNADAQSRMADDPRAALTQLGVDPRFVEMVLHLRQQDEAQPPVPPARAVADRDFAEDEDEDDEGAMRGGCGSPAPKPTGKAPLVSSQSGRISLKVV